MRVHLVDGTYELFRHHHALPSRVADTSRTAATRGVLRSLIDLLEGGATHVGVATDRVIESFRNDLWPGYKTGAGIAPALAAQLAPLSDAVAALGVRAWPMDDLEADDALAAAAARAADDPRLERVLICTPDKDLAQCVRGNRVVMLDRRTGAVRDADGVRDRYGVPPEAIPDYLALVGDAADGLPGIPGWGPRSAAALLTRYGRLDAIPADPADWDGVRVRGADRLASALREGRDLALLLRRLTTLRDDAPGVLGDGVDELAWRGPAPDLAEWSERLGAPDLVRRAEALAGRAR